MLYGGALSWNHRPEQRMPRGLTTLREHTSKPRCLMETDDPDFIQSRCLLSPSHPVCSLEECISLLPSPFPSFSINSLINTKRSLG